MALSDSIIGVESGNNPNAKNPRSSASGVGQFINSTWLATVRAHRPDLAGRSDSELLALKSDPALGREMTDAYAQDNQAHLTRNGLQATPGNTYLAHFAGPAGAVKVLQADPTAPVGEILGADAVKANPFLASMTAADLQAWAAKKMGGEPAAPQAPQAAPQAPMTLPSAQAPVFPQQPVAPPQAQQAPSPVFTMQPEQFQAPQIHYAPRRPVSLAGLQQALGNRGSLYFPKKG